MIAYLIEWLTDLGYFKSKPKPKRKKRNGTKKVTKKS